MSLLLACSPPLLFHVSGLLQNLQRMAHPCSQKTKQETLSLSSLHGENGVQPKAPLVTMRRSRLTTCHTVQADVEAPPCTHVQLAETHALLQQPPTCVNTMNRTPGPSTAENDSVL
jgi:hypothetical protein